MDVDVCFPQMNNYAARYISHLVFLEMEKLLDDTIKVYVAINLSKISKFPLH